MLPKINRLHTSYDISKVRKLGKRLHSQYTTCFVLVPENNTTTQCAFVVSLKVSKKAVDRNRTKRLLRESVHQLLPTLKPVWIVCVAKTNLSDVPLQEVLRDITKVFLDAGIIKTNL